MSVHDPVEPTAERFASLLADAVLDCALADRDALKQHADWAARELGRLTTRDASGDGAATLTLEFCASYMSSNGTRLVRASLHGSALLRAAADRGIRTLRFDAHTGADELASLAELLHDPRHEDTLASPQSSDALLAHGIRGITIDTSRTLPGADSDCPTRRAVNGYQGLAAAVQDSHVAAARGRELEVSSTEGAIEGALGWLSEHPSRLLGLANYQDVDRFTIGHSVRVALLAMHVARAAGADSRQLRLVGTGALLHDIGKSRIPGAVLYKRGKLDSDEWRLMQEHPRLGAEILIGQRGVHKSAISAAFCHHLNPDGGGYPRATLPIRPSSLSNLVHVADVFEALTAIRPYKRELTAMEAFAIMRRHSSDFDPDWLAFFVCSLGLFPIGSHVELTDGCRAQVVHQGPRPDQPVVLRTDGDLAGETQRIGLRSEGREIRIARALRRSEVLDRTA